MTKIRPREALAVTVALLLAALATMVACGRHTYPSTQRGVLRNGFRGWGGKYSDTIEFSPDSRTVAYLWSEGTYGPPLPTDERPRERTLAESITLRWFDVDNGAPERKLQLQAASLGSSGAAGYNLSASLAFSPDSRLIAAVSPGRLAVVDRATGAVRDLGGRDCRFGSVRWRSPHQIVFATQQDKELVFREVDLDDRDDVGRVLYQEEQRPPMMPDALVEVPWSPLGRHAIVGDALIDLSTAHKQTYETSLSSASWDPSGKQLLLHDAWAAGAGVRDGSKTLLVQLDQGVVTDLSLQFRDAVGHVPIELDPDGHAWIDGAHVIAHDPDYKRSFLLRLAPPRVILAVDGMLRPTPLAGWLVLQDTNNHFRERCEWIDISGRHGGVLPGWPPEWAWAPDGRHAVEVRGEKVSIVDVPAPAARP